jgi:hypothetical protein
MKPLRCSLPFLLLVLSPLACLAQEPTPSALSETASGFKADGARPTPADASENALSLSNRDLGEGQAPPQEDQALPADESTLPVRVDGRAIPSGRSCVLVNPRQRVAIEFQPVADTANVRFQGRAAIELGNPRQYELAKTLRTTWEMDKGALLKMEGNTVYWEAPPTADACGLSVSLYNQTQFGEVSATQLRAETQQDQMEGTWSTTFVVKVPYNSAGNGILDGYTVGIYPNPSLDTAPAQVKAHPEAYTPPQYLIPVSPNTAHLYVSSHFRLGDFSPSEELRAGRRHFIALDTRLLDCLEALCDRLQSEELPGDAVRILRGYVSPYRRQILAREGVALVEFSRYQYGDSVTIIVDADGNSMMDDLNGDGAIDIGDADRLAEALDAVQQQLKLWGGIGVYETFESPTGPDTPCVQVDMRGWRERWRRERPTGE